MTVIVRNNPSFKYTIASTGEPGVGYKLFTYEEGTSTKKTTWTSLAKTAANPNPIILDANGEADVWIDGNYKFVLAPPTDTDPPTSPVKTWDAIRSSEDGTAATAAESYTPINGSFEIDNNVDGIPDNWTLAAFTGGTIAVDDTSSTHGENSLKFTSTGSGGGTASTDDYYEVEAGKAVGVRFSIISANVDTLNKVEVYWYNSSQVYLSTASIYSEGAANPTSWTRKYLSAIAPASAKYARIVLTGVDAASTTHSSTNFDNIELDTKFTGELDATVQLELNSLTASAAELNILDGVTASTGELNKLDGLVPTTTELNYVNNVTSSIQTQLDSKADSADTIGWTLLDSWVPTVVALKSFVWNEALYSDIHIVVEGIIPETDDSHLYILLGYSNGTVFYNGAGDYTFVAEAFDASASGFVQPAINSQAFMPVSCGSDGAGSASVTTLNGVGTAAGEGYSGVIDLLGMASPVSRPRIKSTFSYEDDNGAVQFGQSEGVVADATANTTQLDSVRFEWDSSSNFEAAGKIWVYGLKRS